MCREIYAKAFAARQPFRIQQRLRCADGAYRWVEYSGAPRFDHSGTFAGYLGFAVERPVRGRPPFTPDEEAARLVFSLTKREREVLVLIAEGNSTKETAARLRISYKTADSHRTHILEKLRVHETASLVRFAVRAGLIQP
jgi:DNA-binding CsgD family transcriptional regulator